MTKVEKTGIFLGVASIAVGILAWMFPLTESPKAMILNFQNQDTYKYSGTRPLERRSQQDLAKISAQSIDPPPKIEPRHEKLVTSLSFTAFSTQMNSYLSASDKLNYALRTKHLLKDPISFSQLNELMSQILSESSKIKLLRMLRPQLDLPSERDLAHLQSQFLSSSNKSEALSVVYQ